MKLNYPNHFNQLILSTTVTSKKNVKDNLETSLGLNLRKKFHLHTEEGPRKIYLRNLDYPSRARPNGKGPSNSQKDLSKTAETNYAVLKIMF